MAVTYSQFVTEFKQFADPARKGKVESVLADAHVFVGEAYGDLRDRGVKLWAADQLSMDPTTESAARAVGQNGADNFGRSTYGVMFDRLLSGVRVNFFGTASGCG